MSENQLKPFEKISNSLRSDSEIFSNNADFQALRVATLPANAQPGHFDDCIWFLQQYFMCLSFEESGRHFLCVSFVKSLAFSLFFGIINVTVHSVPSVPTS